MSRSYSVLWLNHFAVTPREGGGTRHFELARELGHRGIRVTVAASDFLLHSRTYARRVGSRDRRTIVEELDGVRFRWLWSAPYRTSNWRRVHNWISFALSVSADARKLERPDLVIGSSPHLFAALAGARLARRLNLPFVFEVRDIWPESLSAMTGRRGAGYYLLAAIAGYLYRRAARIVVLARGTGEFLTRKGIAREKIVYIPNGVDLSAFPPVERPMRSLFTALYAGAHGPANGLDVVLEAAALLRDRQDIRILLVGDGPIKRELQVEAARQKLTNVEFRAPVPKNAMPALLTDADAGLMVLRDTPLFAFGVSPNKLFDYLAASLPVVCNVPGEVAEMLRDAQAGEQAVDASPRALADALIRMAERNAATRAAMGAAGRNWVAREHGRPLLAERLDSALRPLLST